MPAPITKPAPQAIKTPTADNPCTVRDLLDGGLQISFVITDPVVISRLRSRAYLRSLETYLWEDLIKRAIIDGVY